MKHDGRIPGLDLVRCVAIFLVVLQHSWTMLDLDLQQGTIQSLVYSSVIYGVPLFVMLSGALNLRRIEGIRYFYKKRLSRVLIPFLIWATLVYILSASMGKYPEIDGFFSALKMYVPFFLTGKINEAYWFVYLILALYLVTPFLQRLFCRDSKSSYSAMTLSIVVCLGFEILWCPQGLIGVFVKNLGFYLLGGLIFRYLPVSRGRLVLGAVGTILFLSLNIWLRSCGQNSALVRAAEILSVFILLSGSNIASVQIIRLSRYSFLIYLTHFVIIRAMYMGLPYLFAPVWYMPVVATILTICVEYLFCRILERIEKIPLKYIGI